MDRGYFGPASPDMQIDASQPHVAVVHSFGLHLLPESFYLHLDGLVIISGFISFNSHANADDSFIKKMLEKLPKNTLEVLKRFYRRCGCTAELAIPSLAINHAPLIQDLTLLETNSFDIRKIAHIPKIVLLHGADDKIVPLEKSVELQQQLPQSKLFVNNDAGHALPFTHLDWCFHIINEEVTLSKTGGLHE